MRDELEILRQGRLNTLKGGTETPVSRPTGRSSPGQPSARWTAEAGPAPRPVRAERRRAAALLETPRPAPDLPADRPSPSENGGGGGRRSGRGWRRRWSDSQPSKPRLRKLRFFLILLGLAILALISTVFGMLMAVASDLPQLENTQQYAVGRNSFLYDDHWRPIGLFAPPNHEVIDSWKQISPAMIRAIVAVEDRRFWSDPGVDIRGIARAFFADITGGRVQGAS